MALDAAPLIASALSIRDDSLARIRPPLPALPDPVPKNVMPLFAKMLTEEEMKITDCDAHELLEKMKSKTWSCESVTRAFLRRAGLAQGLVCLIFFLLMVGGWGEADRGTVLTESRRIVSRS